MTALLDSTRCVAESIPRLYTPSLEMLPVSYYTLNFCTPAASISGKWTRRLLVLDFLGTLLRQQNILSKILATGSLNSLFIRVSG